jgi:hypothetical protein
MPNRLIFPPIAARKWKSTNLTETNFNLIVHQRVKRKLLKSITLTAATLDKQLTRSFFVFFFCFTLTCWCVMREGNCLVYEGNSEDSACNCVCFWELQSVCVRVCVFESESLCVWGSVFVFACMWSLKSWEMLWMIVWVKYLKEPLEPKRLHRFVSVDIK